VNRDVTELSRFSHIYVAQMLPLRADITCNLATLGSPSEKYVCPTALHLTGEEGTKPPCPSDKEHRQLGTAVQAPSSSQ